MPQPLVLNRPAIAVDVAPGGEIILRGSYQSTHDGSTIDAAATTWPANAPGGASVDAGGLIDFEAGGFHLTSRDLVTHEVHAIATGDPAPACAAFGVASPCLALRVEPQARTRLLTMDSWTRSLKGGISLEVVNPPAYAPPPALVPYLGIAAALFVGAVAGTWLWRRRKRHAASPAGRLAALVTDVQKKLGRADPILAAPLAPAIQKTAEALRKRRVQAESAEGLRIAQVLEHVNARLDASMQKTSADKEQEAADELVQEVQSALEAADEVSAGTRHRLPAGEP
jgi:hypothetical protein